ncbi:MAG: calcium/sodium antiporter [Marinospirillum sp.]|uniref:calcium/sodium antiporter n=1 Tax=Marinospirillum sp. TaxID=2183934 RepID=UPI0019E57749|nr:calcium/sodium antiporter [Marinospirillum sp.]MBE0506084.1 calcium/sodium antiporter [Marinospirillum sp.]
MIIHLVAVLVGLVLLVWSADRFVVGACVTAERLGVPVLVIGMLLMGFGTSAPEMLVSLQASLDGNPGLAVGNVIGSNITNIALVLGLTALLSPIAVASGLIRRELPLLLGITVIAVLLLLNLQLVVWKGVVLLFLLVAFITYSYWLTRQGKSDALLDEVNDVLQPMSKGKALMWMLVGLVLLVVSARLLVWGAVELAVALGISDMVIGLTLVAIGTSLPELAASIAAARRNQADLVIGNVIGSNIFNLLAVLPIPLLLSSGGLDQALLLRDLPVMMGLTLVLLAVSLGIKKQGRINRYEGAALLLCFAGYQWWLFG